MDEVIRRFTAQGVRYLLIGGQAVRLHGLPRFSMDWDFFIPPKNAENIAGINRALGSELDAPVVPLGPRGENFVQTYQTRWGVLQFHLGVPGLPDFEACLKSAVNLETETGVAVTCLCEADLIRAKEASGRPEDARDLEFLRRKAENDLPPRA